MSACISSQVRSCSPRNCPEMSAGFASSPRCSADEFASSCVVTPRLLLADGHTLAIASAKVRDLRGVLLHHCVAMKPEVEDDSSSSPAMDLPERCSRRVPYRTRRPGAAETGSSPARTAWRTRPRIVYALSTSLGCPLRSHHTRAFRLEGGVGFRSPMSATRTREPMHIGCLSRRLRLLASVRMRRATACVSVP